ncbi:MAG: DUF255 domain-containing protein [Phycisphaerales bacterium]
MTAPRSSSSHTNRLAASSSPYLLQHAHNPVDWFPWGPEAFAEAARRQVPIFLSVGYSTCYWCHVMERESFEDEETAALMNADFVCIKVDREERPDVDNIYMAAVQLLTRSGGWPMSVWLTPPAPDDQTGSDGYGLKPFYAGTYFPPRPAHGRPSFREVLANIADAWQNQTAGVLEQAEKVTEAIGVHLGQEEGSVRLDSREVGMAIESLLRIYDRTNGGFGGAPKFPQPVYLRLLMEVAEDIQEPANQSATKQAIRQTLDRMATGGMYDYLGGGFHRYSVDERWLVPHFEKMLYDNGQLASLYAKSFKASGDTFDLRVASGVCDYVLREMTSEEGSFFSAQDAEVDGREGLNYVWTEEQIDEAIADEADREFAKKIFGIDRGPNFQDPHHPDDDPVNVLFLANRPNELAASMGLSPDRFDERFERIRARLLAVRDQRKRPGLDNKIIVSWNGLMIGGLADTASVSTDPDDASRYLDSAERAARWIVQHMLHSSGDLRRVARNGTVTDAPAQLEDYAMLAAGLIALDHACRLRNRMDSDWLEHAERLIDAAIERFGAGKLKADLFDTPEGLTDLILRPRSAFDGAMPSGVATMLHALIDLHQATGERKRLEFGEAVLASISRSVKASPISTIESTRALHRLLALDGSLPDKLGDDIDEATESPIESPVQVMASTDRVTVKPGEPGQVRLRVEIGEGFHINAAELPQEVREIGLIPLRAAITGGEGIEADLRFPEGQPYSGAAFNNLPEPLVYSGAIEGTLVLRRNDKNLSGRPIAIVTYQVCADDRCFAPLTVELDLAIDAE